MHNNITVSVIMAEYNTNPNYLEKAVTSILDQTFEKFELIIVDDGGDNDLPALKAKLGNDQRIKIITNKKNMGFVHSLNRAIKNAKSEYIVRMDGDDISSKNRIERLYNFISKHPEYSVVSSKATEFSEDENFGMIGKSGEKSRTDIMRGDTPIHAASIMIKGDVVKLGGYKDFKRAEDLVLWCELLLAGKRMFVLDDSLYQYRVNKEDYRKRKISQRKDEIKARLIFYPKLGAGPIEYIRIMKSVVAGILPIWLVQTYRNRFVLRKDR